VKRPKNRSGDEIRTLKRLKTVHRVTERCCTLFEEFAGTLRDKEQSSEQQVRSRLKEWTERAKASGIAELKAFAVKLVKDTEAVGTLGRVHHLRRDAPEPHPSDSPKISAAHGQ
jgi:hypothetical protein